MNRNIAICEIKKSFDGFISDSNVRRNNRHFDVVTTNNVEDLHCFFVFGRMKLKFVVRSNLGHLISNLNSKTQYQFEILRKMPFLFFNHDFQPNTPSRIGYYGNNK